MAFKDLIPKLISEGKSNAEIMSLSGCAKRTVCWYRQRIRGFPLKVQPRKAQDWPAIQRHYDAGNSMRECCLHFDCSNNSWSDAILKGLLKTDPLRRRKVADLDLFCENSKHGRNALRGRLISDNIIPHDRCAICGGSRKWNGKPLSLILDHINGVNNDHRITNLRFVCPNCDSQLPTFCSRNIKFQRARGETATTAGLNPAEQS